MINRMMMNTWTVVNKWLILLCDKNVVKTLLDVMAHW